ncbi:MAG: hypothetical protein GX131_13540 [candidate division WS1 bacterium]|nr:hypothetical protein [candidate division WS1 bacterium]
MRTSSRLLAVTLLTCAMAAGALAAEFAGPRLDGTVTLRSGETISGVILTAQLGIVDGAEIGSRLRDGGYIAVRTEAGERNIAATDVAAIDVEWQQTGAAEDPKWKIGNLSVTTTSGEVISGQPAWLVHATSLIVEEEDGTQRKIYAFPMAGGSFSPDNLMAGLSLTGLPGTAVPATTDTPAATDPLTLPPAEDTPATDDTPPATGPVTEPDQPVTVEPDTVPAADAPATTAPDIVAVEPGPAVGIGITTAPEVEEVEAGSVFATAQPAIITFEVINPETGNPMQVRFLIVPLPAQ